MSEQLEINIEIKTIKHDLNREQYPLSNQKGIDIIITDNAYKIKAIN